MSVVAVLLDEVGEHTFHILDEGGLKLINEQDGSRVQGVQEQHAVTNRVLDQSVPDHLGNV